MITESVKTILGADLSNQVEAALKGKGKEDVYKRQGWAIAPSTMHRARVAVVPGATGRLMEE